MNKIRVIDLLNMIAEGNNLPKKIEYDGNIFELDNLEKCYVKDNFDHTVVNDFGMYIVDGLKQASLNDEVEIIEESEQDIDIQAIEEISEQSEFGRNLKDTRAVRINELIKAVKQLERKIKEK